MNFLEKDLEEIIYTADRNDLEGRGLFIEGVLKRQLRIGNYGVADLVSFNRVIIDFDDENTHTLFNSRLEITIYELKKDNIEMSGFLQAVGYARGIQRYLENRGFKFNFIIKIALIGRKIDCNSTYSYLERILPDFEFDFLTNYTYSYDIDGLSFESGNDYSLIEEGF